MIAYPAVATTSHLCEAGCFRLDVAALVARGILGHKACHGAVWWMDAQGNRQMAVGLDLEAAHRGRQEMGLWFLTAARLLPAIFPSPVGSRRCGAVRHAPPATFTVSARPVEGSTSMGVTLVGPRATEGQRRWRFLCPWCWRPCKALYLVECGAMFFCRECHGLEEAGAGGGSLHQHLQARGLRFKVLPPYQVRVIRDGEVDPREGLPERFRDDAPVARSVFVSAQ